MTAFETIRTLLFGSIISPLIFLIFAVGFIYFLIGVARYILNAENSEARAKGAQHMFWGIIGLAIMISAFGIAAFLFNTMKSIGGNTGIDGKPVNTPSILKPENQGF